MTSKLPDIMTDQEWTAFIGTFNQKAPTGLRNLAIFTLMREAGLRTCEVIGLQRKDIRYDALDGRPVTVLTLKATKGGKHRNVYLSDRANLLLSMWLAAREKRGLEKVKTVFTTLRGDPIKDSYIREVAARKGVEAGITWRVHPHALRHTFATELLDETGNLALVQDALGHSRPETTRVYAKVKNSALARAMAKQNPSDNQRVVKVAALVAVGFTQEQAEAIVAALPEK
ncbi:MAG: site-specific integrase [Armatimonadia bacterium]